MRAAQRRWRRGHERSHKGSGIIICRSALAWCLKTSCRKVIQQHLSFFYLRILLLAYLYLPRSFLTKYIIKMRFSSSAILAAVAAPLLAFAQSNSPDGPNAFKIPVGGLMASAGKTTTLQWTPTTDGPVTLILRSGASSNLIQGAIIACRSRDIFTSRESTMY